MKKIISIVLALAVLTVGVSTGLAEGGAMICAVRDPSDVNPLPYEGSGKTNSTMSPALQAPSNGKITIYFKNCAFVGKASGNTHPTQTPTQVTVWVERYKSGTIWVTEIQKINVTLSNGAGKVNLTVTPNAIISVHFKVTNVPNGYTFKYTRGVKIQ